MNEKAWRKHLKHATDYSRSPQGWLLFTGTYACGKTHLAAAIANSRADLGQPPMLISVSDLLDHLRATFSSNSQVSLDRRFEEIRSTPLLILDALGEQSPTPWANEKLFQIIDYRHLNKLPTVMTTAKLTAGTRSTHPQPYPGCSYLHHLRHHCPWLSWRNR